MENAPTTPQLPGPEAIYFQSLINYWTTLTLRAVAELGLADHMKDGPTSVEALAQKTQCDASALYRVLRAMSNSSFFAETSPRTFALTPVGELLRSDLPNSFRWMILAEFEASRVPAWHNLLHSLKTGGIAFDDAQGKDCWQYYRENPQQGDYFARWMTQCSHVSTGTIVKAFDFSPFPIIIDVGGGQGAFVEAMVTSTPSSRGIVFDQPEIIATAPERPRITKVSGNFFENVPVGGDLYMMKSVIHDWSQPKAVAILRNIHRAMKPGAKLMVIEMVVSEDPGPDFAKWMDINMMTMTGGRERTAAEHRELLAAAGFKLEQVIPAGMQSLLVAKPEGK